MKNIIYSLVLFMLASFAGENLQAQDYQSAVGLRLGSPVSVSYKKFMNENNAIELYAGFRSFDGYSWFSAAGAYQIHSDIESVSGLRWYYGFGATALFFSFDDDFLGDDDGKLGIGIQGYLGLEYTLENTPISFSADWIPTFFLSGFGNGFGSEYGALSVRYVLGR